MKKLVIFLILLLQSHIVFSACAATSANTFYKRMESIMATTILTTEAAQGASYCSNSATNCCKGDFASSTTQDLIVNYRNSILNFVVNLVSVSYSMAKIQKIALTPNITGIISKIPTTYLGGANAEQANTFLNYYQTYQADFTAFTAGAPTCFSTVSTYIQRAMCYGCDKTNEAKFNGASLTSMPVTQASCNGLVADCATTWSFFHKVGWMMQVVAALNKLKKTDAVEPVVTTPVYYGSVSVTDALAAVNACGASPSAAACDTTQKTNMCKAFFNLWQNPARVSGSNFGLSSTSGYRRVLSDEVNTGDLAIDAAGADLTTGNVFTPTATIPVITTTSWSLGYISVYSSSSSSSSSTSSSSKGAHLMSQFLAGTIFLAFWLFN